MAFGRLWIRGFMYLAFLLYAVLSLILFFKERRISANQYLLVLITLPSLGLALLAEDFGHLPMSELIICAPVFVVAGIIFAESKKTLKPTRPQVENDLRFLWAAAAIIGSFSVYHLTQVGIALFSSNVEIDRFNLGASGLFGLPSRSVLFGLPALALFTVIRYSPQTKKLTFFVWSLFVVSQLSLGFKGSLFTLISTLLLGILLRRGLRSMKLIFLSGIGLIASSTYALNLASRYGTMSGGQITPQYIIDRITLETARPQYLALRMQETLQLLTGPAFWHDTSIFLQRYITGFSPNLTVESIVSATLTGTPPSREFFIVPVTLGGPIYLLLTGGVLFMVFGLALIGFIWARGADQIRASSNDLAGVQLALFLETLIVFLTNGNGAYLLINASFVSIIFCVIYWLTRVRDRRDTSPDYGLEKIGAGRRNAPIE